MNLTNGSALSCFATAVGCTLTALAVNEALLQPDAPSETPPSPQEAQSPDAQALMAAAQVRPSVVPPETINTQEFASFREPLPDRMPTPRPPKLEPIALKSLNSTAPLPTLKIAQSPVVTLPVEEQTYLPKHLSVKPEVVEKPVEVAQLKTPPVIQPVQPVQPVEIPVPPPTLTEEAIAAQYIVDPEHVVALASTEATIPPPYSETVVDVNVPVSGSQYIVEPEIPVAPLPLEQLQTQATPTPETIQLPPPPISPTSEIATRPEQTFTPSILRKLQESWEPELDEIHDIKMSSSSPSQTLSEAETLQQDEQETLQELKSFSIQKELEVTPPKVSSSSILEKLQQANQLQEVSYQPNPAP